ncbi:MAG: tetratricopeptide repeat protein [Beijerinckiaceae bacterium]
MLRHSFRAASSMLAIVVALSLATPAQAANATAVASEMNGYGRLVLSLDKAVKAQVRATSGVVVLSFEESVNIDLGKLASQFPSYVSVVRRDPDGKTIRFATSRQVRTNLMEAGEKLFLDFLPDAWQGLPPSLPQDVIEQLARRARDAEEQLRKTQREREKREPRDIVARVGNGPTFTRLIFDVGQTVPVEIKRDGDQLLIEFDAALKFDPAKIKPQLPESVQALDADTSGGMLKLTVGVDSKTEMRAFREDDTVIIDFPKPRGAVVETGPVLPLMEKPATAQTEATAPAPQVGIAQPPSQQPKAPPPPVRSLSDGATILRPAIARSGEGIQITLPFASAIPAAAFLRNDVMWMVFDTAEKIEAISVPAEFRDDIARIDVDRAAGAAIVRVTLQNPQAVSISPGSNGGWVAGIGKSAGQPTEPLMLRRGVANNGRTILTAKMPSLGQIFWIDDPDTGDRLGIVTSSGKAHGLPKAQNFVELSALPTVHGLALAPKSDDVVVDIGLDEVVITRDVGLTVSLGISEARTKDGEPATALLLDVEAWQNASKGAVRDRGAELFRMAADAPKNDKTEARHKLARFQLANGNANEAFGILKVIEQDDPSAAATKPLMLLRAIAAVETRDGKEATRLLNDPVIALESEASLWRAVLEAENNRWTPALVAFRQSLDALDRYPDDLQRRMRMMAAIAGIENKDPAFASQQLDMVERLQTKGMDPAKVNLLRGRIADQQNRANDAVKFYEAAARTSDRAVEVEARLENVLLALRDKKIDRALAIAELETIGMIWRRSEPEVRALAQLGEMYAEDSQWRQAFSAARRANEVMPQNAVVRQLHDNMAKRFEALFLDGKGDELPKVEAVGLFYDFRNLMPISRRGDEIVRRLADRLADLDLLDQATELLQHQVDNRLGGLKRAQVASRLAVLHLLNRKPAEAVQVLKASRLNDLPEDIRRGRLLLEARGLSELSRTDLALEALSAQSGDDVNRLRADILWRGKRWREAGEAIERVLGDAWQPGAELTDSQRADVMRAGVSYVLADDRLALDRLRQKFAPKMANSIDARSFAFVSGDTRNQQKEFRDIARTVVAEDTLAEFLNVYRQRYPDAAGAPRNPKAAEDARKELEQRSQQQPAATAPTRG